MIFKYIGYDITSKKIRNKIEAEDENQALAQLEKNGVIVERIWTLNQKNIFKKKSPKLFQVFLMQVFSMLRMGYSVDRVFQILSQNDDPHHLRYIYQKIDQQIKQGKNLSDILNQWKELFSSEFIYLVFLAEKTNRLKEVFELYWNYYQEENIFKNQVRSVLFYPLFLLFLGGALILTFHHILIPKILMMMSDFNQSLPISTRISTGFIFVMATLIKIVLLLFVFLVLLKILFPSFQLKLNDIKKKFYLIILKSKWSQFVYSRLLIKNLKLLIGAGMNIMDAIELIQDKYFLTQTHQLIQQGMNWDEALKQTSNIDPEIIPLIANADSNDFGLVLSNIDDVYQLKTQTYLNFYSKIIEPISLFIVAVILALVLIAVFIPILDMSYQIQTFS